MGSSTSKAVSKGVTAGARKYPARQSPTTSQAATNAPPQRPTAAATRQPGPTVRPQPHAAGQRDEAINLDAADPDFARSLRQLGAVQPNPTMSPTSAFPHPQNPNNPTYPSAPSAPDPRQNPALLVLERRSKLQGLAERESIEAGRRGHAGREFLDVSELRNVLLLRDEKGLAPLEIEGRMGLKAGVVQRLGDKGVVRLSSL